MAQFEPAVEKTLQNEGGFFHNPRTGEIVNYGITLAFVISCGYCETADEQYIKNLTIEDAKRIYLKYFWDPHNFGEINDQTLASKTFDLTVNMGPGCRTHSGEIHEGALTLLQRAIIDCGTACVIDGCVGPYTLSAINTHGASKLLTAYRARARARYEAIAAADPCVACDLPAWLARLDS